MKKKSPPTDPTTRILRSGRRPKYVGGSPVNSPVVRASTVLFDTVAQQREAATRRDSERTFTYGVRGTPTNFALEDVICELEGAFRARLLPSGLAAIAMTLIAYLKPGDHVLLSDSVYEPTRRFTASFLQEYQIAFSFFAANAHDIEQKIRSNTRMILAECPGSLVYEICDLPKLAEIARHHGLWLAADNTWGSGYQYRPLALGADISIMAATKYLSGHSDVMMGSIATTEAAWGALAQRCDAFGMTVSPDDAYLVLRGVKTLAARLSLHEKHALQVAQWLSERQEIATVFCPALPQHPGHDIWLRDFTGTNGLITFEMTAAYDISAAERLVDNLDLFGIGMSWGGYESLAVVVDLNRTRSVDSWAHRGPIVRLHVGLEAPSDLISDLEQAFDALW